MESHASPDWQRTLAAVREAGLALLHPAGGSLAARRMARALMEEAAVMGGGRVFTLAGGELLLGAQATGLRVGRMIAELTGRAPESWILPEERESVEARCRRLPAAETLPSLAELEARCRDMPVEKLARVTFFAEGTGGGAVAQRLGPAPLGLPDPALEAMARDWLCRRLMAALADPIQRSRLPPLRPGLRLILDLPQGGLPGGSPLQGGVADDPQRPLALLPLASCADPARFAATGAALRAAGWAVGLVANDARALDWVEAPGLAWAVPAGQAAPRHPLDLLIALGRPVPDWCRRAGILHEGVA